MSTTDASSSYAQADEYIQYKLQKARRRIKWADLLTAGLLAAVLLIGYVLVFTVLDHWVVGGGFSPWTRAIGLGVVIVACAAILVRYVAMPWFKTIHPLYAARVLDSSGSGLKGALVSLVDLNSGPNSSGKDQISASVRSVMEKRAAVSLADVNVDEAIDQRWLMKLGAALFILVVLTSIYAVASPKGINLLRPLTVANAAVATQTRILKVNPGTTTIAAGESLEVSVDIGGQLPEEVILEYTTRDKTYVNEALTLSITESDSKFQTIIVGESDRGLRQDFSYRIVAGDAVSQDFQVTVDQPPTANVLELNYEYPNYMMIPRQDTADGNIAAWEGTKVQLVAEASVPIKRAVLKFSDSSTFDVPAEELNLTVQGQQILGTFTLQLRDDRSTPKYYRIEVQDFDGRTDPQPTVYAVNIRPDKAPIVKLLDPIRDLNVPANSIIPLLVQAEDPDFMLRNVKLHYDINGELRTPENLYDGTRTALIPKWTGRFEFRLEDLGVRPGDVVNYYVTARDNKPPLGTMSRTSNLKLVITEEATEQEVQQRLKQDRQMQEQEFKQDTDPQPDDADQKEQQQGSDENPEQGKAAEGEGQKGEGEAGQTQNGENRGGKNQNGNADQQPNNSGKPDPNGNEPDRGRDQQTKPPGENDSPENNSPENNSPENQGDNSPPDSKGEQPEGQQPGDSKGGKPNQQNQAGDAGQNGETSNDPKTDGQSKPGATNQAGDSTDSNESSENLNPDQEQSPQTKPSRSVDDGEAMQKLLEKYREQNGGEAPPSETEQPSGESETEDNQQSAGGDANPENSEDAADPSKTKSNSLNDDSTAAPNQEDPGTDPNPNNSDGKPSQDPEQPGSEQQPDPDMKQPGDQTANDNNDQKAGQQDQDPEQQDGKKGEDSKSGEQDGKQGADSKSGEQDGKQGADSKSGEQGGKKGGDSKPGEQDGKQGGDSKSGEQGGKKGEDSKPGEQDGKQGGDSKPGEQDGKQGGDSKSGEQGGKKSGDSKSGEQGGKKGEDSKPGEQGGKKGEDSKPGEQGGKKGGDSKSGEQDGKKGEDSKPGEQGGKKGGDSKSGEQGGKKGGGKEAGKQGGQQNGGKPGEGQTGTASGKQGGMGAKGGGAGAPQGDPTQAGTGAGTGSDFQSDDPNVQSSAEAADLVLKRLQQDLQRGDVDQELLDELGWTQDELKQFNARMQKKLDSLKTTQAPTDQAENLRRRKAEELLKSLDLQGNSKDRIGNDNRDIEQQDTTSRRSTPPARYKGWMELFQRGLSKGKTKPRE